MSFDLSEEAKRQLDLRYRIAASAARLYLEAGFTVVYQDILIGPALAEVAASFADIPLSLFVLCPRPEIIAARDAARSKTGYPTTAAVLAFDRVLREETPRLGLWLDTSDWTAQETAKAIWDSIDFRFWILDCPEDSSTIQNLKSKIIIPRRLFPP